MAYGDSIGLGNITENWLFQFGFYNGDTDGNGDGGFSAVTQTNGTANQLKVANTNASLGEFNVDDSSVFVAGDFLKVDNEIVKVTSITNADTIAIVRGQLGTTKATHSINAQIYWNNFFPMAFSDILHDATYYRGVIINRPSIRSSINLKKSTSKTGNMRISIPDFDYNGSPISQELYGGTRSYINYEVRAFCRINQDSLHQIGTFRLTDISTDGNKINLSLTSSQPWDLLTAPQVKSNAPQNVYKPLAYGTYEGNTSSSKTEKIKVFPIPVIQTDAGKIFCAMHKTISDGTVVIDFYDKTSDLFPVLTADSNTATVYGIDTIGVNLELERTFRLFPSSFISSTNWNNGANIITDDSNFAHLEDGSSGINFMAFNIAEFSGKVTSFIVRVRGELSIDETDGTEQDAKLLAKIKGVSNTSSSGAATIFSSDVVQTHTMSGATAIDGTGNAYKSTSFSSSALESQNSPIGNISIGASRSSGTYDAKIFNAYYEVKTQAPESEPHSSSKERDDVSHAYCGNDGLPKTYSGGSGVVTKIHEAHRELLKSFAGVDAADNLIETNFSGEDWSDFNTAKTNWLIRYWKLQPDLLKNILEKLQFEGGFIFKFTTDNKLKYIYLKQSMSATHTLTKQDISNVSVKPSSFNSLVSKMTINYEKHPAVKEKKYVSTVTSSNDSIRKKYNIQTPENILEINLDAYVAPSMSASTSGGNANPNQDFYSYYDNILGDVKIVVKCNVVNPKYYDIDTGDIISFSDMYPETPFGHNSANWSGLKFIVTSVQRTLGSVKIEVRQI